MSDADCRGQAERLGHGRCILPEIAPSIRRGWFAATAVASSIHRVAVPSGKMRDDLVPTAGVESGGVAEEDRRVLAGPFKKRNLNSIDGDSALVGHLFSLAVMFARSYWGYCFSTKIAISTVEKRRNEAILT